MARTTTTLASACGVSDTQVIVSSATGFAAGNRIVIDGEILTVLNSYVSGTIVPVLRGQNGTYNAAHAASANVTTGLPSDFANAGPQAGTTYPTAGRVRTVTSYSASGAITLPVAGSDAVAILNGTSTLTMTVAAPTKDMDGSVLTIIGNGKSSSTVAFDATNGIGNAGSGYDVVTFQNSGQVGIQVMAANGFWVCFAAPAITGTTAAISTAIA